MRYFWSGVYDRPPGSGVGRERNSAVIIIGSELRTWIRLWTHLLGIIGMLSIYRRSNCPTHNCISRYWPLTPLTVTVSQWRCFVGLIKLHRPSYILHRVAYSFTPYPTSSTRAELYFENMFKFASLWRNSLRIQAVVEFHHRRIVIAASGVICYCSQLEDINIVSASWGFITLTAGSVG